MRPQAINAPIESEPARPCVASVSYTHLNPNLTAAIDDAIAALKADGTIDELNQKWFGA